MLQRTDFPSFWFQYNIHIQGIGIKHSFFQGHLGCPGIHSVNQADLKLRSICLYLQSARTKRVCCHCQANNSFFSNVCSRHKWFFPAFHDIMETVKKNAKLVRWLIG